MTTDDRLRSVTPDERESLLTWAARRAAASRVDDRPARSVGASGHDFPLSSAQQRLWFLDQLAPGSAEYNVMAGVRLRGRLDRRALEGALAEVVARHEVLRTRFPAVEGQPVQRVGPVSDSFALAVADLHGLGEQAAEREVERLAEEEARLPFDLAAGPLLRARLLRVEEREHVLLLTMHHVVCDGWSVAVLVDELSQVYAAAVDGLPSPLPPLPAQYRDYAVWERAFLDGERLQAQLRYWRERLAGCPVLELPTDRPRPALRSAAGAKVDFALSPELTGGLEALSRRERVSPFMTLLAAFQWLLGRCAGQEDVCVGSPVSNRGREEFEPLIGFFVNTLVLRGDLSGNPSFRELLARTRESTLAAYANQDLPFERLVDELNPARDLSRTPLYQVMLVLQNAPGVESSGLRGLELEWLDVGEPPARSDLELVLTRREEQLSADLVYARELFDRETIERLAARFVGLLERVVEHPDVRLGELELVEAGERERLLVDWNRTAVDYPLATTVDQLVERQAEQMPEAAAVACGERKLSYAQLDRRANRLAHHLRAHGVGAETVVGLCLERSLELVVALLAVLKAGGAYLPLDPSYPPERLAFMLADSGAELVLGEQRLLERLPAATPAIGLDRVETVLAALPTGRPSRLARPDNLAYVIYTSGSTGAPKGVAVAHRSACNLAYAQSARVGVTAEHEILQLAASGFDASVSEILLALCNGALLRIPSESERRTDLAATVAGATNAIVTLPPSALATVPPPPAAACPIVLSAGEPCPAAVADAWSSNRRFFNAYGPTETTVCATMHLVGAVSDHSRVPIGRPLANTRLYVLDRHLGLVPIGSTGELFVGGVGLARGYLGRPGLTAERFVPDPFTPGQRLYATGDLVRYRGDGTLEFVGRSDEQVKVRGYRVEPAEVEAALLRLEGIAQAAVVAREDRRLVAYLVAAPDQQPRTTSTLRTQLGATLPDYMLPAAYVWLDQLPRTANGKIDHQALPAPDHRPELDRTYTPPRTPLERLLATTWAQLLGVERVGVEDNFFELGGDSILAIQVVARVRQQGWRLSVRDLFTAQTVAALAALALPLDAGEPVRAEQGLLVGELPLAPVQQWFFETEGDLEWFNQALMLRVPVGLSPARLRAALAALLRQHDLLRACYQRDGAEWRQRYVEELQLPRLPLIDLSQLPGEQQTAAVAAIGGRLQAGLRIEQGRLLSGCLFELGGRGRRLLLAIHHLAVDAVSWRMLLEDIDRLLHGQPLPPKTSSYRQWTQALTTYADSDALQQELDYWLTLSQPGPPLPRDHDGDNDRAHTDVAELSLDAATTTALLSEAPRAYHTEINDLLLTALALSLHDWTGHTSHTITLEGHGREPLFPQLDLERTVGWFTSLFPVRLTLSKPGDFGRSVKEVKETLRRVPNRGIGYGILRYLSSNPACRPLRTGPQPELAFNYLGQLDRGQQLHVSSEPTGATIRPSGPRPHLLELNGAINDNQLRFTITYPTSLYDHSTITTLAHRYRHHLHQLVEHCRHTGGLTPTDIPLANLDQDAIDRLVARVAGGGRGGA